jgi:hypothetical protein
MSQVKKMEHKQETQNATITRCNRTIALHVFQRRHKNPPLIFLILSSITFAIFTNAKHHAFATYTIARNCKYRNNTLQSYWNNTFSAHKQTTNKGLKMIISPQSHSAVTNSLRLSKKSKTMCTSYSVHLWNNILIS